MIIASRPRPGSAGLEASQDQDRDQDTFYFVYYTVVTEGGFTVPVGVGHSSPGAPQQQVNDHNAEGGNGERQNEHADDQFAELGLRVGRRRVNAKQMKPDERRHGDDQRGRPGQYQTRSERTSRNHVSRGARHHVTLLMRRQRSGQL